MSMSTISSQNASNNPKPQPMLAGVEEAAKQIEPNRQPPGAGWPALHSTPISVLIPVRNEQRNIVECLRHLSWAEQVVVVDSQSEDATALLAQAMGAEVLQFTPSPEGWPKKKNWAIANAPWRHEWLLIMDADEFMTSELAAEIDQVVRGRHPHSDGCGDGYWINRRFIFMNRWIRHSGYYPSWNVRLFKHKLGRYERIGQFCEFESGDMEIHEHLVLSSGEPGYLKNDFIHLAYPDLDTLIEKHNRYATWEAHAMHARYAGEVHPSLFGSPIARRRWVRSKAHFLPWRPFMRFFYSYVLRLGFLDGRAGYTLARFMGWYEFIALAKYRELRLGEHMRDKTVAQTLATMPPSRGTVAKPRIRSGSLVDRPGHSQTIAPPTITPEGQPIQMQPEASPWSLREKIVRVIWMLVGKRIFRWTFHNWYPIRNALLRCFGARIGRGVTIRPSADIEIPWTIDLDDGATVGDYAILYGLGEIRIGKRAVISQYSHLCAGTHDYTDPRFKLIRSSITIGDDVWIGADAFIGPDVTIGNLTVVGARSSVYKDMPAGKVCGGNPCRPIKDRVIRPSQADGDNGRARLGPSGN